jgi:hypothetical protein
MNAFILASISMKLISDLCLVILIFLNAGRQLFSVINVKKYGFDLNILARPTFSIQTSILYRFG